jgi:hypothetical protein
MTATLTTAQVADAIGTTPRELRKFLRSDAKATGKDTPGKGARYSLPGDKRSIVAMKKKFAAWDAAREEAKAQAAAETTEEVIEDDEVESDIEPEGDE